MIPITCLTSFLLLNVCHQPNSRITFDTTRTKESIRIILTKEQKITTINKKLPTEFKMELAPKPVRYGRYYFDYKFDLKIHKSIDASYRTLNKKKSDESDTGKLNLNIKKEVLSTKADSILNKVVAPFVLKYQDIIFVKMRNPVETPGVLRTTRTLYPFKKTLQEIVQDSADVYWAQKRDQRKIRKER